MSEQTMATSMEGRRNTDAAYQRDIARATIEVCKSALDSPMKIIPLKAIPTLLDPGECHCRGTRCQSRGESKSDKQAPCIPSRMGILPRAALPFDRDHNVILQNPDHQKLQSAENNKKSRQVSGELIYKLLPSRAAVGRSQPSVHRVPPLSCFRHLRSNGPATSLLGLERIPA